MTTSILGVSFDTNDAVAIATFWASALGRTVNEGASETFAAVAVGEGSPVLMFHKVPEPKTVKNRLHFDLKTSDFAAESERLLGLGATQLTALADNGGNWVTFADPDGNEFDLIPG
jgi:predicted enzyme related to lactoylglutathione lyase